MFGFFKKKIHPRVFCNVGIILKYMQSAIDIDAPIVDALISYGGVTYKVGIYSDYSKARGFFDTLFFLDNQEFDTFDSFKDNATFQMNKFVNFKDVVEVIKVDDIHPSLIPSFKSYTVKEEG